MTKTNTSIPVKSKNNSSSAQSKPPEAHSDMDRVNIPELQKLLHGIFKRIGAIQ
jgi:hypothetical protein